MSLFTGTDQAPKFDDVLAKYKDNDGVAKAVAEKDAFIEQLKRETAELRQTLSTATPVVDRTQEILDQLAALKNAPTMERQPTGESEQVEAKSLSLDDVEAVIQRREARVKAEQNVNAVKAKLIEQFGDNYGTAIKLLAEKNGLSPKALDDLAAMSPQLVLNLMGQTKFEKPVSPPSSSVMPTGSFKPTADGHQPRSWWNEFKAKDKKTYLSQAMQMRQYKDAMALGEAFEDV